VHEALRGLVPHLFLFGPQRYVPGWLTHAPTWTDAEAAIRGTRAAPVR
jgi:hypothetical protein